MEDPEGPVDVVIIKIPRTLALLEDQLRRLRPLLHKKTVIVGAGMTRTIHTSTVNLFETLVGPTKTSLAKKKSRLIHSEFDPALNIGDSPFPSTFSLENGMAISNEANVFSRSQLDHGTRIFLENLPTPFEGDVIDLGCGNGVVGAAMALSSPNANLTFIDESYQAIASAETTFATAVGKSRKATFLIGDALEGIEDESIDLILCNPPFHDKQAVQDATAWAMFNGAKRVLRPTGRIMVVGNRHLRYHAKLKRIFGNSRILASNPKFVVAEASIRG